MTDKRENFYEPLSINVEVEEFRKMIAKIERYENALKFYSHEGDFSYAPDVAIEALKDSQDQPKQLVENTQAPLEGAIPTTSIDMNKSDPFSLSLPDRGLLGWESGGGGSGGCGAFSWPWEERFMAKKLK